MSKVNRRLSLATAIDKSRLDSGVAYLFFVKIEVVNRFTGAVDSVLRFVRNAGDGLSPDSGLYQFQGNGWQPAAFDLQLEEAAGEVPSVSLKADDVTGIVREQMELSGGIVGGRVEIMVVASNHDDFPSYSPEFLENFVVTNASVESRAVSIQLGARSLLSQNFPRRRQTRDHCQFTYKGVECKYSGAMETCDRTLQGANGCAAHDNAINFGGYPGVRGR